MTETPGPADAAGGTRSAPAGRAPGPRPPPIRAFVQAHYGLAPTRVRRLPASDKDVHRVDVGARSFVLHAHRTPSDAALASSMEWLDALREDGAVRAPEPVRTLRGGFVAERRTLLRWVSGRTQDRAPRLVHFEQLGRTMAHLHRHAAAWTPPAGFERPTWDAATVFCEGGDLRPPCGDPWALVPRSLLPVLRDAAARARPALDSGGKRLIHADLHLRNVVFAGGAACPIDFDDAGFGHLEYDLASALYDHRFSPRWPAILGAFVRGYSDVRPMQDLARLDDFLVGRATGLALWCCSLSETSPRWRERLPRVLAEFEATLVRLSRCAR